MRQMLDVGNMNIYEDLFHWYDHVRNPRQTFADVQKNALLLSAVQGATLRLHEVNVLKWRAVVWDPPA